MSDRDSNARRRELGDGLRRAMEKAKYHGQDIARQLGISQSWVSRLLTGNRPPDEVTVSAILAICRVDPKERERLLALCNEPDEESWLQHDDDRVNKQATLISHEAKAVKIGDFQPTLIPGLLQTAEYVRTMLLGAGTVPTDQIDDRVAVRLARQDVFERYRPAQFTFFIHEFVLRLPVGGPTVMADQLHHLLRMLVREYITIRVIPAALGAHAAISGSFKLMEFSSFKPVVYLQSETSSLFLETNDAVAHYRRILALLAQCALSKEESRELIATLATELYSDREALDDLN